MATFLQALLIAGGLLPPAAMLASLFAAVWLCEGRREREAAASRSHLDSG
ncbi:MAG: hypothetical protein ACXVZ4_04615 [Gaiellaceae bacterium]